VPGGGDRDGLTLGEDRPLDRLIGERRVLRRRPFIGGHRGGLAAAKQRWGMFRGEQMKIEKGKKSSAALRCLSVREKIHSKKKLLGIEKEVREQWGKSHLRRKVGELYTVYRFCKPGKLFTV